MRRAERIMFVVVGLMAIILPINARPYTTDLPFIIRDFWAISIFLGFGLLTGATVNSNSTIFAPFIALLCIPLLALFETIYLIIGLISGVPTPFYIYHGIILAVSSVPLLLMFLPAMLDSD